jgi:Na+/H+-translocating membrane pyrophosphatase
MHVDLPNGISVEIRHNSASGDADGGLAAMNEMEKAMEELVDHFSGVGNSSADSGSTANPAASQRALAAYAEQAKQKDQTSLTAGLGVSRAS